MAEFATVVTIGVVVMVTSMNLIVSIAKRHAEEAGPLPAKHSERPRSGGAGCAVAALSCALIFGACLTVSAFAWFYLSVKKELANNTAVNKIAMSMVPLVLGNFKNRTLRYPLPATSKALTPSTPRISVTSS